MRQGRGSSKRPPRRPASANTLPPLTEVRLLSATGATSLQKVRKSDLVVQYLLWVLGMSSVNSFV